MKSEPIFHIISRLLCHQINQLQLQLLLTKLLHIIQPLIYKGPLIIDNLLDFCQYGILLLIDYILSEKWLSILKSMENVMFGSILFQP